MTLHLKVLASSSAGNCGLLIYRDKYFLIDAGFSGKRLRQLLQPFGIIPSDLSGVFVTHEHQDHIIGLKVLRKCPHIQFYANYRTANAIERKYELHGPWKIFNIGEAFYFDHDLSINTFPLPHDAIEPVGYTFKCDKYQCAWATDFGHMTQTIADALSQSDEIVLESNHDEQLLRNHPTRPAYLKERILGPLGHLSNRAAYDFLKNNRGIWQKIYLAHLSKDCNSYELVHQLFQPLAQRNHFELIIIDPRTI